MIYLNYGDGDHLYLEKLQPKTNQIGITGFNLN